MIHRLWQGNKRRGVYAPVGVLVACGVLAAVGVAGAAQQAEERIIEIGADDQSFVPPLIEINTGDTVTWDFTKSVTPHNAAEDNREPQPDADPTWKGYSTPFSFEQIKTSRTFNFAGEYKYYCQAHPQMVGTIKVEGDPVEPTPTPTPTATPSATPTPTPSATPTPTPTATATPDDHTSTPPPRVTASDTSAPGLSGVKVKSLRRAARVTFNLSEAAAVTLRVKKRSGKVVRTVSVQARPGTRAVTVRSSRLKRGRYTVELQARDASGNRSPLVRSAFRIRR